MNKKGEITTGVLIFIIIAGILGAVYLNQNRIPFSVYTPTIAPSGSNLNPYINNIYYPTDNPSFACGITTVYWFRTLSTSYSDSNNWIAYDINDDAILEKFGATSGACSNRYCSATPLKTGLPGSAILYEGSSTSSGDICICPSTDVGKNVYPRRYSQSDNNAPSAVTTQSATSYPELFNTIPLISYKFVYETGKIREKACSSFANTYGPNDPNLICANGGEGPKFFSEIGQNGVKCLGNFQPNKESCGTDGKTLYTTSADGNTYSTQSCAVCTSITSDDKRCDACISGQEYCTSRSGTNGQPSICSNGQFADKPGYGACTGLSICQTVNNLASCTVGCVLNQLGCQGVQPTICDVPTQTMVVNGPLCLNSCVDGKCTKVEGCIGNEGKAICMADGVTKKKCSTDGQSYTETVNCAIAITDGTCQVNPSTLTAECVSPPPQCITGVNTCTGGVIRSCVNGKYSNIIDECNGLGCSTATNKCTDQCTTLDAYSCYTTAISQVCALNITNNQKYKQNMQCGVLGCDAVSGKCVKSGSPNSFICIGQDIYGTDSNGFAKTLIKQCNLEPSVNVEPNFQGLKPYCSEGKDNCKVCELNQYICTPTNLYQCGDEILGTKINSQECSAGCVRANNNIYCDQLYGIISATQNFPAENDVVITGTLKGSVSGLPIKETNYIATLTSIGITAETKTGKTDVNGRVAIGFGIKPLGEYNILVQFTSFPELIGTFDIKTKVTNDYIIKIEGSATALKIPGKQPKVIVIASKLGKVPDDIIVSNSGNLTVNKKPISAQLGRYELELKGEPGIYTIGLKAIESGVSLDEYEIIVEIAKPKLTTRTNIPLSVKSGKKSFDVQIEAPIDELTTGGLVPDIIKATISHSPSTEITLKDLGGGKYTFDYDFKDIGTYTLTITALKAGYESVLYEQQIQVSEKGDELPPSVNQQPPRTEETEEGVFGDILGSSGLGGLSTTKTLILAGAIIFGFYLLRRRKRR